MSHPILETRAFRLFLAWLPYVLAVLVYVPSLGNGFLWDDHTLIENNALAHDLSHIWTIITHDFWYVGTASSDLEFAGRYYRPVVSLAFAIQATLFGVNPAGFHAVSLLLHLACCALVHRALVLRLPGDTDVKTIVASLGTMLFAIHPTRPEVVGWISGATDLLMMFWSLVALNFWVSHRHRPLGLAGVIVASIFALLSKETAIVLPFALAVDTWLSAHERIDVRKEVLRASAVIVPVVATLALRSWFMPIPSTGVFRHGVGNLAKRVLASLGEYVIAIVWHVPGTVQISEARFGPEGQVFSAGSMTIGAITLLAILAMTVLALVKRPLRPWLADVAWSVAFLAPVANILPLGMKVLVAARFLYAPLFGVVALLCRSICHLSSINRRTVLASAAALTIGFSAFFGFSSMRQLESFESDESLWEYEYRIDRQNSQVLAHLLSIHGRRGDDARVVELLRDLQELSASEYWPPSQQMEFFWQTVQALGRISRSTDREDLQALARAYDSIVEKGEASFSVRGISVAFRSSPKHAEAMRKRSRSFHLDHALMHVRAGNLDRGIELLREMAEANPQYDKPWFFLGWVHGLKGEWEMAAAALAQAESRNAHPADIARLQRDITNARGISEAPGNPIVRSALAYRTLGAPELVRATAEKGLREHPGEPNLVAMLVELELSERRPDAAMTWIEGGRQAAPELAELWNDLEAQIESAKATLAARF